MSIVRQGHLAKELDRETTTCELELIGVTNYCHLLFHLPHSIHRALEVLHLG
jgi:hypothetical protein